MENISEKQHTVALALPAGAGEAELSQQFVQEEHALGFWQAMGRHWPAVAWVSFMNLVRRLSHLDMLMLTMLGDYPQRHCRFPGLRGCR